jgi:hypothetical protein
MPRRTALVVALLAALACSRAPHAAPAPATGVTQARVVALLSAIADDSMEGRGTGTPGAARAARLIAAEMRRIGLEPAGDSAGSYFQHVPLAMQDRQFPGPRGETLTRRLPSLLPSFAARDTIPRDRWLDDVNVIGVLPGSDPVLRDEVVVLGSHFDHLGIGRPVNGDSIYNGADDDASGTVAVLEAARALAGGTRPKRTVLVLVATAEEWGLLGTDWYLLHPARPLDRTVAELQVEMIGRPDSLAGGFGRAWLTGFERSTMGEALAAAGLPVGPDRRPQYDFFERSDNYAFARRGIVAHTLSSYNMHKDYHQPSDDVAHVDVAHMTRLVEAAARAARLLADGPRMEWKPNGRP